MVCFWKKKIWKISLNPLPPLGLYVILFKKKSIKINRLNKNKSNISPTNSFKNLTILRDLKKNLSILKALKPGGRDPYL